MNEIVLDLELITPMFLKADNPSQGGQPVLRAAPIRGELRYWLRALTDAGDITSLKQSENNVFGSTQAGSVMSVWVKPKHNLQTKKRPMLPHRIPDIRGSLESQCFLEEQNILLGFRGRPGLVISENAILSLLLWLNLGGVGKRARRGFGSLQCKQANLANAYIPQNLTTLFWRQLPRDGTSLAAWIGNLLGRLPGGPVSNGVVLPPTVSFGVAPYPCFQNGCWVVVVGHQAFTGYTSAMQDFWRNHLRTPANIDSTAYGEANPRHASPVHVHLAKSEAGYHIVLTAFFAAPAARLNTDKIRGLLQDCCTTYGGTAFFR